MTHVRDRTVRFAGLLLVLMTCLTVFTCNKKTARVLVDSIQADCVRERGDVVGQVDLLTHI